MPKVSGAGAIHLAEQLRDEPHEPDHEHQRADRVLRGVASIATAPLARNDQPAISDTTASYERPSPRHDDERRHAVCPARHDQETTQQRHLGRRMQRGVGSQREQFPDTNRVRGRALVSGGCPRRCRSSITSTCRTWSRSANRTATPHIDLIKRWHGDDRLVIAGAVGDPPYGGLLVFRSAEYAEAFAGEDPYVEADLVVKWWVEPWTVVT